MSGANQNQNYRQRLPINCPYGKIRSYSNVGRPFTKADLYPRPLDSGYERSQESNSMYNTENSTQNYSSNVGHGIKPYTGEGRPFNPAVDITDGRLARLRNYQQVKQTSSEGSCLNLEYEMAKNKQIALERLRAEQTEDSSTVPCSSLRNERQPRDFSSVYHIKSKPQMTGLIKGKQLNIRTEAQCQQARSRKLPNECRNNIQAGRYFNLDRIYDYNMPSYSSTCTTGRPLDLRRDLTFCHLNLPAHKGQRARSCPTQSPKHSARIYPRTTHSVCASSPRLVLPSTTSGNNFSSSSMKKPVRIPNPQSVIFPVKSPCQPIRTPAYPDGDKLSASPGAGKKTITTTVTSAHTPKQKPTYHYSPTSQQTPTYATPEGVRNRSSYQQPVTPLYTDYSDPNLDSAYGQMPLKSFAPHSPLQTPVYTPTTMPSFRKALFSTPKVNKTQIPDDSGIKTPKPQPNKQLLNKTQTPSTPLLLSLPDSNSINGRTLLTLNQSKSCILPRPSTGKSFDQLNTSYSYDNSRDFNQKYSPLSSTRTMHSSPIESRTNPNHQSPPNESRYYNATMFDGLLHNNNSCLCPPLDYAKQSSIDLIDETPYQGDSMDVSILEMPCSPYTTAQDDSMRIQSYRIPQEDLACREHSDKMLQIDKMLETDFEATEYQELPSAFKSQQPPCKASQTCPPCEQSRASLFRCLAKKLGSTYDFISSAIVPQKTAANLTESPNHTPRQICGTTTFSSNALLNTTCPQKTAFGFNSLVGDKTMNAPISIRECAHAKRCGRVKFDNNSDKCQVQDPNHIRKVELEALVNDTYCPGIIQETIDGQENFNKYSFNLSFNKNSKDTIHCDGPPLEDPMTLLEAFSIRLEKDRSEINKDIPDKAAEGQIGDIILSYFANRNPTDLNRSIKSLLLSECLQDHKEKEKPKTASLEAEVQKVVTTFPNNDKIKLVGYTGHTTPLKDDPVKIN